MAYGPLTIDDSNNMAIFGTTNPKCYSAYSSGVILSWLHTNKNSVTPIKCIVNSGTNNISLCWSYFRSSFR